MKDRKSRQAPTPRTSTLLEAALTLALVVIGALIGALAVLFGLLFTYNGG